MIDALRRGPQVVPADLSDRRSDLRTQKDSNLRPSAPEDEGRESGAAEKAANREGVDHAGTTPAREERGR